MKLNLTKPLVIFDLEATGLDLVNDRIIQIAYIKVNPDGTIYSINGTIGVKHYKAKPVEETNKLFPIGETVMYLELPSYSYVQIDGDTLYFDSYAVDGDKETRVDQFAIKKDLATFIDTDASIDEECAFYDYFTDKY